MLHIWKMEYESLLRQTASLSERLAQGAQDLKATADAHLAEHGASLAALLDTQTEAKAVSDKLREIANSASVTAEALVKIAARFEQAVDLHRRVNATVDVYRDPEEECAYCEVLAQFAV